MNVPAIETRGLQKKYGDVLAVRSLDLRVERGEIFGLVGADGAGKTSIIQMLCTLSLPSAGDARILGKDTVKQAKDIKPQIGYVSEKFNLYPTLTVEENMDFFARLRNIPRDVAERRKTELLRFCRLEEFRRRQSQHLSGGMQKKLALAASLLHEPDVLFLDEPTTGVDPVSRREFWKIITGFLSRGITILVSTPYLDEAERFNRVAFMHQGEIIACDTPEKLKSAQGGETLEIKAIPVNRAMAALTQSSFPFTPHLYGNSIHIAVDSAQTRGPEARQLLERANVTIEHMRSIPPTLEDALVTRLARLEQKTTLESTHTQMAGIRAIELGTGETAIRLSNLTRKFGNFTAVDNVSFEVKRGEIFGLLGPNGSGKTTTIRMILGLIKPTSGSTHVLGTDLEEGKDVPLSRMGYMSQKFSLYADLTVEENINFYGGVYRLSSSQLAESKKWVLEMAGLRGKEKMKPPELSGGWRRRLALGCAIIHGPEVVFLDEPTAGVDPLSRRSFWELIQDMADKGTTVFVTTHYMDEAEHCHRLGMFYQGKLIALGSARQLKTDYIKGELVEVISSDYARAFALLSADTRYQQANLFGNAIHIKVDDAGTAIPEIKGVLERSRVSVHNIGRIPFTMEDVFISLVEEHPGKVEGA